jgi:hypothetical protein
MCAQVDYADEDFREALANVTNGMSFCVKPTAAQAAGFMNAELLAKNAQSKKVGQAVAETVSCNDLVLAPDYDLEARIAAFEERELEAERRNPSARSAVKSNFLTPVGGHRSARQSPTVTTRPEPVQREITTSKLDSQREAILNLHRTGKIDVLELADMLMALPEEQAITVQYPTYQTANGTVMEDLPMRGLASHRTALVRDQGQDIELMRLRDVSEDETKKDRSDLALNEPESTVPTDDGMVPSNNFSGPMGLNLGPNDKQFTPEQSREFLTRYYKKPMAIKDILRQMDGGKGLGNSYFKHASWLLKVTGAVK